MRVLTLSKTEGNLQKIQDGHLLATLILLADMLNSLPDGVCVNVKPRPLVPLAPLSLSVQVKSTKS